MNHILPLFQCIFLGEFGLLTLMPRYLLGVLFPVMAFLEILGQILPRLPFLRNTSPLVNQCFYSFLGLGCTTAALAALDKLTDKSARSRMAWILVFLIPCSAKLTILAAFASMVSFPVFMVFLLCAAMTGAILYWTVGKLFPLANPMTKPAQEEKSFSILGGFKKAFRSVLETAPAFAAGSVLVSLAVYLGVLTRLTDWCGPFMADFFHLPSQAAGLLLLGIMKRDFAAASLLVLGRSGLFSAAQLIVTVLMMTFSVPCFNSSVLLIKQQRLPGAVMIWLGSLLVSVSVGKCFSEILFVCLL